MRGGRSSFGLVTAPGAQVTPGLAGLDASLNRVSEGYFATLEIPLRAGRDFLASDDASASNVAVVNKTMARRLFPGGEAIGRTFEVLGEERTPFRVVGVVADAELRSPGQPPVSFYYVPIAQWYNPQANLNVRAAPGQFLAVSSAIASAMIDLDASVPSTRVRPLAEALEVFLLPQRLATWVAGVTGLFGLLLAGVGIYGVTAFLVTRRSREVAIRLALGASNADVFRLLLRQGSRAPAIGLVVGMVLATALSVAASRFLAGATVGDPVVLGGAAVTMASVALAAMLMPVYRLLRGAPMTRLRDD